MTIPALIDTHYTPEEYLALERAAEYKSEYVDGHIIAMSGASLAHNLISFNLVVSLRNSLDKAPCTVLGMDMRVRVDATSYRYPDVIVVCGDPMVEDSAQDTLLNPIVIFEVLSPSTEAYDRGEKGKRYRNIHSLQHYVLVAQQAPQVEVFTRQGDFWTYREASGLDASIHLDAIDCTLALADVYAKVQV